MPPRRDPPPSAHGKRLVRLAAALYGDGWRPALAAEMMVDATTVSRWERGLVRVPQAVFVAIECKLREKG